jgi:hypothetical protein
MMRPRTVCSRNGTTQMAAIGQQKVLGRFHSIVSAGWQSVWEIAKRGGDR